MASQQEQAFKPDTPLEPLASAASQSNQQQAQPTLLPPFPYPPRQLEPITEERVPCYLNRVLDLPLLQGEIITVAVGDDEFKVRKGLLSHHFSGLADALRGRDFFDEQKETFTLDGVAPDVFQLALEYMNTGKFYPDMQKHDHGRVYRIWTQKKPSPLRLCQSTDLRGSEPHDRNSTQQTVPLAFDQLFDLFVFADKRGAQQIRDATLSVILQKLATDYELPMDLVIEVQTLLPARSPLMMMLWNVIAMCVPPSARAEYFTDIDDPAVAEAVGEAFLVTSSAARFVGRNDEAGYKIDACMWHCFDCSKSADAADDRRLEWAPPFHQFSIFALSTT